MAAAPPAGQVVGNEAKNEPAAQDANNRHMRLLKRPRPLTGQLLMPGDKSSSISNERDAAPTHETTTPAKAVLESGLDKDPASDPPPTDVSAPPLVPEKDSVTTNQPTPASEETSASPSQTAEPLAAPTKAEDVNEVPTSENADSSKPSRKALNHNPVLKAIAVQATVDKRPAATQDGDGKADDVTNLTLRMDRVRGLPPSLGAHPSPLLLGIVVVVTTSSGLWSCIVDLVSALLTVSPDGGRGLFFSPFFHFSLCSCLKYRPAQVHRLRPRQPRTIRPPWLVFRVRTRRRRTSRKQCRALIICYRCSNEHHHDPTE